MTRSSAVRQFDAIISAINQCIKESEFIQTEFDITFFVRDELQKEISVKNYVSQNKWIDWPIRYNPKNQSKNGFSQPDLIICAKNNNTLLSAIEIKQKHLSILGHTDVKKYGGFLKHGRRIGSRYVNIDVWIIGFCNELNFPSIDTMQSIRQNVAQKMHVIQCNKISDSDITELFLLFAKKKIQIKYDSRITKGWRLINIEYSKIVVFLNPYYTH